MQCRLLKDSVRTSNWESRALSYEQQLYAATDAFASLRLYQVSVRPSLLHACQNIRLTVHGFCLTLLILPSSVHAGFSD